MVPAFQNEAVSSCTSTTPRTRGECASYFHERLDCSHECVFGAEFYRRGHKLFFMEKNGIIEEAIQLDK